ncbi:hypothetical protein F6X00_11060 [Vibrio vulnificus]|uniref:hypothetical protein n=1 Tax=Vibrio vulnificus TaxID=672 RepID=UPI0015F7D627|nr:hypothetical protein [Vibrio vulnificus]MCA0767815.1 hypothetical protein [Vibrio vulnificus]MDT9658734.1 hypothetical protein [Vibrio vulnificus]QMV36912.1 hypothetical protein F6X00_11060 [Vibrio vulnificus]HAT8544493.1 hypothetical protein [Vibrio vulnificus]HDY7617453.1 hypothetical protein [Vibrio vulnificus]
METRVFELLQPWAGVPTWYTTHPMDRDRFNKVMHAIAEEFGCNFDVELFESALRKHAESNPAVLGNPKHWDDIIVKFTLLAEAILAYESVR